MPNRRYRLLVSVPGDAAPHSLLQQSYYMLFLVDDDGVPSVASWVRVE
jgi:hypothetical protein